MLEEVFRSVIQVEAPIQQPKNSPLQVKVLQPELYLDDQQNVLRASTIKVRDFQKMAPCDPCVKILHF